MSQPEALAKQYPIIIRSASAANTAQIVQNVPRHGTQILIAICPDFGLKKIEVSTGDVGQEPMLIVKMRRDIASIILDRIKQGQRLPTPTSVYDDDFRARQSSSNPFGDREYVSVPEAARFLGVHVDSVRRMFDSGDLEGHLTGGGHRRIRAESVSRKRPTRIF